MHVFARAAVRPHARAGSAASAPPASSRRNIAAPPNCLWAVVVV